jgi:hypothetical protein
MFKTGKARMVASFDIFGTRATKTTDWVFKQPEKSLAKLVAAIKGSAPYKADIGG